LEKKLYQFQKEGVHFGIKSHGRVLIADEMGVGKTIQALGIAIVYQKDWPVLILCPSSLVRPALVRLNAPEIELEG
jgi:SNF2 family DNA or RNA helicase